jgi:hypothetical protein
MYWSARRMGDWQAMTRGPGPYAKRVLRRKAYARTNGELRRVLRGLGL